MIQRKKRLGQNDFLTETDSIFLGLEPHQISVEKIFYIFNMPFLKSSTHKIVLQLHTRRVCCSQSLQLITSN